MFLDDELLELGRSCDLTENGIKECATKMMNVSFANLAKRFYGRTDNNTILMEFKRVNKTWQMVANVLAKEGRGFIKIDGFKLFVESKPEFKGIFF